MERDVRNEHRISEEILELIRSKISTPELAERLEDYHENDIAEAFEQLSRRERMLLYRILSPELISDIFTYFDDPEEYIRELDITKLAKIITEMDSDEAADLIDEMDDDVRKKLRTMLDEKTSAEIDLIRSYEDDEIGSIMTTNFILIPNTLTIRQAMNELIRQAGDNDNISTIYVKDRKNRFYGAIDLKDLIVAREHTPLEDLISTGYPYFLDHEKIPDIINNIKDYEEDSLPVLNEAHELLGIITSQDIIELVEDEIGDDYAKLAGLTAEEDLKERTVDSMKKRLPWLIALLFLGMLVSSVVGAFEGVVALIPIIICFQSMVLDMAGNVGTQSLAVTIRVLMDETLSAGQKAGFILKEVRVGFVNGLVLGILTFGVVGVYVIVFKHYPPQHAFLISGCVGIALLVAMIISSLAGSLIPMFFHKIHVDPAVASGPLITTVDDLVAILTYYSLAWVLLVNVAGIHAVGA